MMDFDHRFVESLLGIPGQEDMQSLLSLYQQFPAGILFVLGLRVDDPEDSCAPQSFLVCSSPEERETNIGVSGYPLAGHIPG